MLYLQQQLQSNPTYTYTWARGSTIADTSADARSIDQP
ncbi:hypothetical protein L1278_000897 [Pontibacter sp. HSC-36F09]|nr:hypothetical protein [Pontibacter sp. HSC-36F09]